MKWGKEYFVRVSSIIKWENIYFEIIELRQISFASRLSRVAANSTVPLLLAYQITCRKQETSVDIDLVEFRVEGKNFNHRTKERIPSPRTSIFYPSCKKL